MTNATTAPVSTPGTEDGALAAHAPFPERLAMTAQAAAPARSLHEICEDARMANCGQCWAPPGKPCTRRLDGAGGFHVARLGRAMRRGLISGPELIAVLQALVVFTDATIVYDQMPGGAR